jgi:4'-phosphopantetheinyl transferase
MLRLYWADVSALETDEEAYPLSAYRKGRLSSLRPPEKRRQSIGVELLLRQALADCAPEAIWPPEITVGEQGRPEWNLEGLYFNLAHSGSIAACVIADRPVGLDVQKPCDYRDALVRRFFSEEEQAALSDPVERDRRFVRLWSMKESYIKALGRGLAMPLGAFSVVGEGRVKAAFWCSSLGTCQTAVCVPNAASAEPDAILQKKLP